MGCRVRIGLVGRYREITAACERSGKALPGGHLRQIHVPANSSRAAGLSHGNSGAAIDQLQAATPYDLAIPGSWFAFFGNIYAPYVRGQAYLSARHFTEAVGEFQKVLDHPGIAFADPVRAIARLQFGRTLASAGDREKARAAYQDFLTLWKDADPEIPLLKQAKAEYTKL
jgi:eukaryotic-like serine/threonine-protein kinase